MAIDVQAEALRRKSAGDPRPIPVIIAEISAVPQAAMAPAPEAVTPTPGQPVPVGKPVDIKAQPPAPQPAQAAVPPMTTPFNPVDKARAAAVPKVEQVAETSATDAALASAKQKGNPAASLIDQVRQQNQQEYAQDVAARQKIRDTVGVPKELEEVFKRRDERLVKQEADIAEDEKKQVWNALAMAGFQMAQSTSPYFLAALSAGMESGLGGYNASKAALAEKKARMMDARDSIALERYKAEKAAEGEQLSDIDAVLNTQANRARLLASGVETGARSAMLPGQLDLQSWQAKNIQSEIGSRAFRDALAGAAFRRGGDGEGGGGGSRRVGGVQYDIQKETDADGNERQVLMPKGPGAVSLVEGPYGRWMPKRYADNPRALADVQRAAQSFGAVGFEFDPGGDPWAVMPNGKKYHISHVPKR